MAYSVMLHKKENITEELNKEKIVVNQILNTPSF
jgi:hypothetical protein